MQRFIFLFSALLFDIATYRVFGSMLTNGADIVSITPKLAAPQLLFDTRRPRKDLPCSDALDNPYNLGWAVRWHRLDKKMHMIPIGSNFQKRDLIALGDVEAHCLQHLIDFFTEHDSTIFRWAHYMVEEERLVVSLEDMFAHSPILLHGTGHSHLYGKDVRAAELRGIF